MQTWIHDSLSPPARRPRKSGIILITVLLFVFLIAIVLISLMTVVRQDRNRARSFLEAHRSEMLIDMATQEVMAKLMDGGEIEYKDGRRTASMTASPGMLEVRRYEHLPNRGYQRGESAFSDPNSFCRNPFAAEYEKERKDDWQPANPQLINLFSRRWYAPGIRYRSRHYDRVYDGNTDYNPARVFNINTSNNPFHPGQLYLTGSPDESMAVKDISTVEENQKVIPRKNNAYKFQYKEGELATDRPIHVQWLPIYQRAEKGPVYTDPNGHEVHNEIVGRYAYWVDVENTKVNLRGSDRLFERSDISALTGLSDSENPYMPNGAVFGQTVNTRDKRIDGSVNLRAAIEAKGMYPHPNDIRTLDGTKNHPGSNDAAVTYHGYWFDWRPDGARPYASDTSMVDWRTFTGMRPWAGGEGRRTTIEGLIHDAAQQSDQRFNTLSEVYSLLDPKVETRQSERGLAAMTAMRRTYGNAVTLYGWEDERDPLGLDKLDIVAFQREGIGGETWHLLAQRLEDPRYYRAYYPGAYPNKGTPISFIESLNGQCGDNDRDNPDNGLAAAYQMMVNMVEYAQPHDQAPFLDEDRGIIGAKSMPYVTEVATRARNGLWELYQEDGPNGAFDDLLSTVRTAQPDIESSMTNLVFYRTADGRPLSYFLTNVVIDLAFGMVNPNPFARETEDGSPTPRRDNTFDGELSIDYAWTGNFNRGRFPDTADRKTSQSHPVKGLYVARPKDTVGVRVSGTAPYFRLGMIPGRTMDEPGKVTCLQIEGWQIRQNGKIFHTVPLPHPGQTAPVRPWWSMAQPGYNTGISSLRNPLHDGKWKGTTRDGVDWHSLCQYTRPYNLAYAEKLSAEEGGEARWMIPNLHENYVSKSPAPVSANTPYHRFENVAVGWFTARTISEYIRDENDDDLKHRPDGLRDYLYLDAESWTILSSPTGLLSTNPVQRAIAYHTLSNFVNTVATAPGLVERVTAVDPTLGHRTGNPNATGPTKKSIVSLAPGAGHFYGSNGHPWRHYLYRKGHTVDEADTRQVPIYGKRPPPKEVEITRKIPVGNTFVEIVETVLVRQPRPITGYRTRSRPRRNLELRQPCLTMEFEDPTILHAAQDELGNAIVDVRLKRRRASGGPSIETPDIWLDTSKKKISGNQSFFASAPKGDYMVSIGEIGFVHSGMLMRPIDLTKNYFSGSLSRLNEHPDNVPDALGAPMNGPPMHMLLDLFTPGAFRENGTATYYTEAQWRDGNYRPNSPSNPRRGTWNINSLVAHDGYLAVREGRRYSTRQGVDPLHPYWVPSAWSNRRVPEGKSHAGSLDPYMSPFPRFRRGWESWIAIIGGDYTPYRSRGYGIWRRPRPNGGSYSYSAFGIVGMPRFSWSAGRGASASEDYYDLSYVNFDPEYGGLAKLFTKGRQDRTHTDVRGRISTDVNYPMNNRTMNLFHTSRYDVFPLRHHLSEVVENSSGKINAINTALNPYAASVQIKGYIRNFSGHPGRFMISGIYANAPVALVANQISTSANVFTIHVVTQSIRDRGPERSDKGVPRENVQTGIGYMDESDEIIAEHWAQTTVARITDSQQHDSQTGGPENNYRILYHRVLENTR